MPESEKSHADPLSKTQRKKDMQALQQLGKKLIELPEAQLAKLILPETLLAAIHEAHRLKTHESQRRHLQYIGKIMRDIDPEPIQIMLKNLQFHHDQRTAQLHQVEKWRDELIVNDEAYLQAFLQDHPNVDRQQLRQWVRKAKNDLKNQKNTGGETGLFRFLRDFV